MDKNKDNKPKKQIKTFNKCTVLNPETLGSTTHLYNPTTNQ
jgi:ribosomal protein S19